MLSCPGARLRPILVAAALAGSIAPALADVQTAPFADASRIVSIGGSLTEIVYALGEEGKLVARDSTAVYPEAAFKLPDVGYMRALSPENVLSLNPSGIIMVEGSGPPEAVEVLKKASVPLVVVPERFTREGIVRKIDMVGKALGVEAKAEALAAKVEHDIAAAEAVTAKVSKPKRVLFVLSAQGGKIMASGTGTAADGIIRMAGGENVIGEFQGYKQLTDEAIITAAPDVILVMSRGGDHTAADAELLANPAIASTPAARDRKLVRMDGAFMIGFWPRTAQAVRELAAAFYGSNPSHAN